MFQGIVTFMCLFPMQKTKLEKKTSGLQTYKLTATDSSTDFSEPIHHSKNVDFS